MRRGAGFLSSLATRVRQVAAASGALGGRGLPPRTAGRTCRPRREAVDRYRAGELDPFEVDHVLFHYSRAAKELWKFCNSFPVEMAAAMIREQPPPDWWERGAPRVR
jgi:hypothetical protein